MQTIAEAQAACDRLAKMMTDKGVLRPVATYQIESGKDPKIDLRLGKGVSSWDYDYHSFKSAAEAEAFIRALPSPDERHRNEFLTLAGKAADYAAKHLPDDEIATRVRATITAEMKRLSENAITAA